MFPNALQGPCSVKVHFTDLRVKLSIHNLLSLLLNLLGGLTVRCYLHETTRGYKGLGLAGTFPRSVCDTKA